MKFYTFLVHIFLFLIPAIVPATTFAAIPKPPTSLTATSISATQINLAWQDASTDETAFELEVSLDGKAFVKLAEPAANVVVYQHDSLTASTAYWYRIRAKNASGVSAYSNIATATTKVPVITIPKAPAGLTATAVSGYQVNIFWTDNATDETGFELERSLDGTSFVKLAELNANVVSFQNTGLTPVTRYWYRVLAKNSAGKSAYSNVVNVTTPQVVPAAPEALAGVSASATQINLSWTDKADNETGYQVERSADGRAFTKIADLPANASAYQNVGLAAATLYFYRVRAINAVGSSLYSNVAQVTTQNIPVPDAPAGFTAVPLETGLIQLRWAPLTGNAVQVVIERSKGADDNFTEIARLPAATLQYEDRQQFEIADYYYRLKAINAGGSSPYSLIAIVRASTIITSSDTPESQRLIYMQGSTLVTEFRRTFSGRMRVHDMRGVVRQEMTVNGNSRMDLGMLSRGIYIVSVESGTEVFSRKILLF